MQDTLLDLNSLDPDKLYECKEEKGMRRLRSRQLMLLDDAALLLNHDKACIITCMWVIFVTCFIHML